jgi:two-component system, OmpR family, phosphate regulon response regulator PhoB
MMKQHLIMNKRILIVDDDTGIVRFYHHYLSFEGYAVAIADSCSAAEALITNWRPDLIIIDWCLPGTCGDIWAMALRARPGLAAIPIMMLTRRNVPAAAIARMHDYRLTPLQKPFSLDQLSTTLSQLLTLHPIDHPSDLL